MRKLLPYEAYLYDEVQKYGWIKQDNYPAWLALEMDTFYWIMNLSCKMRNTLESHVISKNMYERIKIIPEIRFLRYRDISPVLKGAIAEITVEFVLLQEDLSNPEMWLRPYLLSRSGVERWRKAAEIVSSCRYIKPDSEWREKWKEQKDYSVAVVDDPS